MHDAVSWNGERPGRRAITACSAGPARALAALCMWFLALIRVSGLEYYVAPGGNNTNTGTSAANPWRTIRHAVANVASGDVVNVAEGGYSEWIVISNAITLAGSDIYHPDRAPFARHESLTVIRPYDVTNRQSSLITALTNVVVRNLTIIGDSDTNGVTDIKCGIYSTNRSLTVSNCVIENIGGYGICHIGDVPLPDPSDTDALRGYFGYNMISNITHTNALQATGIFLRHAPSTCEYNEICSITGQTANAGMYIHSCYYTCGMSQPLIIAGNLFENCTMALWANEFGTDGDTIRISSNTVADTVIGIRVSEARGRARITGNRIEVSGVSHGGTAARALWIEADYDPWNPARSTDHQISDNNVAGSATNADNSIGMLFQYDSQVPDVDNNGVRATLANNSISGFNCGIRIVSGSSGVGRPHDPLVDIVVNSNSIAGNITYGLYASGNTNTIDATDNWWGSYLGPTNEAGDDVSGNADYDPWALGDFGLDSDNDGIPDCFDTDDDNDWLSDIEEISIGTDPAESDTDGDTQTDREEWIVAGTDPTDPSSLFAFTTATWPDTNGFTITWPSASNRLYAVYRCTNLIQGFGVPLTNVPAEPPTNTFTDIPPSGLSSHFYRVTVTNGP